MNKSYHNGDQENTKEIETDHQLDGWTMYEEWQEIGLT